ncbi:hypothetical protein ACFE04_016727 [Oxalis oulophora]
MVFSLDPAHGNFNHAVKIFNHIQQKHLLVYNVMIKAYTKKGEYRKVLPLFSNLKEDGLFGDNYTYPFVFKAIALLCHVKEGEMVYGFVVKHGLGFDTYVCNSLIDMYGEFGKFDYVRKVFDEMPNRDVVSWNVLISGYVKCQRFEEAVGVFKRMRKETCLRPDEATVVSTLSACTVLKNLELGKELHCYVKEEFGFTTTISNALLDMYCKCGCLSVAREIFDQIPKKNVICWTSMVSGYVNSGQLDEARLLFEKSPVKDIILWTAMMNGYVQFNRFDEAVKLFQELQGRKLKPDKFTVVSLLTGCAQLGALEQGEWTHNYINENKIVIDVVLGTALIEMYAKCGFIEKALEIFYGLQRKDTASWTSIICGLATNGKTGKALQLFSEMRQAGSRPDEITFIGVLSACSHGGLVNEGRAFFDSMIKDYQIEPKLEHYGCLVDLLGRAGILDEAEKLIDEVPTEINATKKVPLYSSLLSACRIYGNIKMGERVADQLVKIESYDSSVLTLLANIYASAERWDDVMEVRSKMKNLGVNKVPGCSAIEIDGTVHEFLVGDPSHPEMDHIYFMLDLLAKPSSGLKENKMELL